MIHGNSGVGTEGLQHTLARVHTQNSQPGSSKDLYCGWRLHLGGKEGLDSPALVWALPKFEILEEMPTC